MSSQRCRQGNNAVISEMFSDAGTTTLTDDLDAADDVAGLRRQLRKWDERSRSLAVVGQILWSTPPDGQVDDMPLWRAFTGQSADEVRGWGWLEALHPDDRAHVRRAWRRSVAERRVYVVEYRLRRADGVYCWFLTRGTPVVGADGVVREWAGSSTDITEHKHADEDAMNLLAVTDTALSYLADSRPERLNLDGLLRDLLDRIRVVMDADIAAVLLTEADGQALLPRAVRGPEALVTDRLRVPVGQGFAGRIAATGAPLIVDDLAAFNAVDPFPREQMRSAVGVPLLLHRRVAGVLYVATAEPHRFTERDVHLLERAAGRVALALDGARLYEQTQAARADAEAARADAVGAEAERQAEQLDRVFEGMTDGVLVYDTQGRVLRTNEAARRLLALDAAPPNLHHLTGHERVTLYGPRDPDGRPITPDDWLVTRAMLGESLMASEARDLRMRALDGRELEVGASAAPLHDAEGHVVGAVLILSDRTERNRLVREGEEARAGELALRELNQRLDTFFAMAAHDLRTPVTVTKMRVQLAQRQLVKAAAQLRPSTATGKQTLPFVQIEGALEATERDLDRLLRLVLQLLDVSRARAGMMALERRACDLSVLIHECVEDQRLLAPQRTLALELPSGDSAVVVDADADRLGQVIANYLSNAARYSPEERPIEVALRVERDITDGGVARVEVRDHGRGIPPSEREGIWARFQRARSAGEAEGLGLGLYIARLIVELHGGQVGVESEVGRGSTFWFTLPLLPSGRGVSAGDPSAPKASRSGLDATPERRIHPPVALPRGDDSTTGKTSHGSTGS